MNELKILSIDLGFSGVKCCFRDPNSGELVLDNYISATAKLEEKPDEVDQDNAFQLAENYYVLGPQALKVPRQYLLPLKDYETLKVVTPIWISFLLNKYQRIYGIKFDKICIGLSLVYKDKADDLLEYITNILMLDPDMFLCLPQGTAAKVAIQKYGLSLDPAKRTQFKYDNFLLFDIGSNSIDVALVIGSMSSTASSIGLENHGVCKILYDIIDYIYQSAGVQISRDEAKVVLDTGIWKRRGRNYDLSAKVHELTMRYLVDVIDLMDTNKNLSAMVENIQNIIIIGGGGVIFQKYYHELLPEMEKRGWAPGFWTFPEKDAEYFNAISYYLIGDSKINNKQ